VSIANIRLLAEARLLARRFAAFTPLPSTTPENEKRAIENQGLWKKLRARGMKLMIASITSSISDSKS
jgi:hypothetical protein